MRVAIIFNPSGEEIEWGFAAERPRIGDDIVFVDPAAPHEAARVVAVTWMVTDRGCSLVKVRVEPWDLGDG